MYIRNPLPTCHSCERNLLTYTSQRHNTRHMFLYLITGCVIGDFPRLTIQAEMVRDNVTASERRALWPTSGKVIRMNIIGGVLILKWIVP